MLEIVAIVEAVEILGKSYAGAALWEFDARWAVVVSVESVGAGEGIPASLAAGSSFAFAVHSPTHVFAYVCSSDDAVGLKLRFELSPTGPRTWRVVARERA